MTHTSENYGDVGNFSGVTYVMLPFMNLKFVGTWAPTAKITVQCAKCPQNAASA